MAQLSIIDMLTLAKAGYKKSDIDKILQEKAEPEKPEEPQAATAPIEQAATISADPIKEPEKAEEPEQPEAEVDYKKLYEQAQADLKAAQDANNRTDLSGVVDEDPLKSLRETVATYI